MRVRVRTRSPLIRRWCDFKFNHIYTDLFQMKLIACERLANLLISFLQCVFCQYFFKWLSLKWFLLSNHRLGAQYYIRIHFPNECVEYLITNCLSGVKPMIRLWKRQLIWCSRVVVEVIYVVPMQIKTFERMRLTFLLTMS